MGMTTCKECGNAISTKAKTCPSCGSPLKQELGCLPTLGLLAVLFVVLVVIGGEMGGSPAKAPMTTEENAYWSCREMVKQRLHNPSAAQFDPYESARVQPDKGGSYRVRFYGRVENAFGALRAERFDCHLQKTGTGWLPIEVKSIPQ